MRVKLGRLGKPKALSWKAVACGKLYCAPACGGGCTKVMHAAALRRAKEAALKLGTGWEPVVSENLGWHAKAVSPCGRIAVHIHEEGFMAFLGPAWADAGVWVESGRTAREAVRKVIAQAKASVAERVKLVEGL